MERIFPRGTWPVMLTPFNKKGAVDYAGLKALTNGISTKVAVAFLLTASQVRCSF